MFNCLEVGIQYPIFERGYIIMDNVVAPIDFGLPSQYIILVFIPHNLRIK